MMIWLVFVLLTACVVLFVARPLFEASPAPSFAEAGVYRIQLAELEREAERGTIGRDETREARARIERRLLAAGRRSQIMPAAAPHGREMAIIAFALLAVFLLGGAASLYLAVGAPDLPDQPLDARLDAPVEQQSIGIQLVNIERRLRENPNDAQGWTMIAPVYFKLGQFDKAADAWRRAILLGNGSEDALVGLAEALTFAKDGIMPEAAKQAFALAVQRNPKSWRGRLWLGLSAEQDGRSENARQIYEAMLADNPPDEWKKAIEERLNGAPSPLPAGPDSAAQQAMIRGMVAKLAARLKENGADLEGWLKLVRSYVVLHEDAKAGQALMDAQKQFAGDDAALRKIDALVESLSFKPAQMPVEAAQP
jgi:cytochrome c-type biogenesis protein CcmH